MAHDRKHDRIAEISCAPSALANYFTESDLPFEITPAFFHPEVLLKYKMDREKYWLTAEIHQLPRSMAFENLRYQ